MDVGISMDAYLANTNSIEAIKKLDKIGFKKLDFNLSDFCYKGSPLDTDYQSWFYELKETANEFKVEFSQIHAPFYHVIDVNPNKDYIDEMTKRCFCACKIMKIPYAVFHPMYFDSGVTKDNYIETLKYNTKRFISLCEVAENYNTSVVIENIFNMWNSKRETVDSFGVSIEDILNLISGINKDNFGVCLDTGHANCAKINPANFVKQINKSIKVLHVHDNDGTRDQHVAPFVGNINWDEFVQSLYDINFDNVFSLEIHNYVQRMPNELIDDAVELSYKIACFLVNSHYV